MDKQTIKKMRSFNRYYTVWLDVLDKPYLESDFSWPESRVLFEIFTCGQISATELCERLSMDKSYMSRILSKLEKKALITRTLLPGTKGIKQIRLTDAGNCQARQIDQKGDRQIIEKLRFLDEEDCRDLCTAMEQIEKILRKNDVKTFKHQEKTENEDKNYSGI